MLISHPSRCWCYLNLFMALLQRNIACRKTRSQGSLLDWFLCMDWCCVNRPTSIHCWALRWFLLFYSPKPWCQVFILIYRNWSVRHSPLTHLGTPSSQPKRNKNHNHWFDFSWNECNKLETKVNLNGGETRDIIVYVKMVNQHLPSLFSNATLKIYPPPTTYNEGQKCWHASVKWSLFA